MTLIERITQAGLDVGGKLKADKRNNEQKYDYVSADKILSICGQALFSAGVAVLPSVTGKEVNLFEYTDSYGKAKKRYDYDIVFIMTVTDGETSLELPWAGAGSDYSVPDKALYKAITSGHKYFLMKLLCIGEGNEDGEHEQETKPEPRQKQAARNAPDAPNLARPTSEPTAALRLEPYKLSNMLDKKAKAYGDKEASQKQRNLFVLLLDQVLQDDSKRHIVCKYLFGEGSSKEISGAYIWAALDWLDGKKDDGGAYSPSEDAEREINAVYNAAIAENQPALV